MRDLHPARGFTLVEVMIVVAIIGILASIALPSFQEQVAKGRRTQAKTELLAAQQWMERFYSENYRYDLNSANTAVNDASQFGARFSTAPRPGDGTALYNIALVVPLARDTYTIRATRIAGAGMAGDRCGDLTVDGLGRRSIAAGTFNNTIFSSLALAIQYCWN